MSEMLPFLIVGLVVIVLLFWVIGSYNRFIKLRTSGEEAFSTMDVYMKKRYDLIPNLVETVKGYAAHESSTFEKVVEARNMAQSAKGIEDKLAGENMLTGALKSLFALSEAYPALQASSNFMELQGQLKAVEVDIANARKYYNAVVRDFNIAIQVFPANIIAGMFKFKKMAMYEVGDVAERDNVSVKF